MKPHNIFKALADDTRLKTLLLIQQEGEVCVCELMTALEQSQPTISRHLARLRRDGLLLDRRQGQWVFYRLHPDLSEWVVDILRITGQATPSYLADCQAALNRMGARPERAQVCCT